MKHDLDARFGQRMSDAALAKYQTRVARRGGDMRSAATLEGVSICASSTGSPMLPQLGRLLGGRIGTAVGQHDKGDRRAPSDVVSTSTAPGSTS